MGLTLEGGGQGDPFPSPLSDRACIMSSLQSLPRKRMHARHTNWGDACLARSVIFLLQARLGSRCRARTRSVGDLFVSQLIVTRVPHSQAASLSTGSCVHGVAKSARVFGESDHFHFPVRAGASAHLPAAWLALVFNKK